MKLDLSPRARLGAAATAIALVAAAAGYGVASLDRSSASISGATEADREVIYWYDQMYPNKNFEKPGKSRSEERCDGEECDRTCKFWWSPYLVNKHQY